MICFGKSLLFLNPLSPQGYVPQDEMDSYRSKGKIFASNMPTTPAGYSGPELKKPSPVTNVCYLEDWGLGCVAPQCGPGAELLSLKGFRGNTADLDISSTHC